MTRTLHAGMIMLETKLDEKMRSAVHLSKVVEPVMIIGLTMLTREKMIIMSI